MSEYFEMNGQRIKHPDEPAIYLMDNGQKRLIPSEAVYKRLFADWGGVIKSTDVHQIPSGPAIADNAFILRIRPEEMDNGHVLYGAYTGLSGTSKYYFTENNVKRLIEDVDAMIRYHFSSKNSRDMYESIANKFSNGPTIRWPEK